jgi:ATP-dependent Zn protease
MHRAFTVIIAQPMSLLLLAVPYTNLAPHSIYLHVRINTQADILDSALLRPGRFDRRVQVDVPDFNGRVAVLKVHARGKPLSPDVDLESIARRTPGFSGAQLQNLLNEAAIFAARQKKTVINWEDVDNAVDRLLVGLEKKNAQTSEKMREIVAYHEAGMCVSTRTSYTLLPVQCLQHKWCALFT